MLQRKLKEDPHSFELGMPLKVSCFQVGLQGEIKH